MVAEHKNGSNTRLDFLAYLRLAYGFKAQVIPHRANVLYVAMKQSPVSESYAARKIDQRLNSVYRSLLSQLCLIRTALLYIVCAQCF